MKRTILCALTAISSLVISAQNNSTSQSVEQTKFAPTDIAECIHFGTTKELRDIVPLRMETEDGKTYTVNNKLRRYKHTNPNALPLGNDPVWQQQKASHWNRAPIQNWDGTAFSAYPPDPSAAAGPDHVVHMVNSEFTIYNKTGNTLYGPATLGSLLGGSNDGDPIVMYDEEADRWFLSQFKTSNNSLQIAVSQTADPLGSYYTYEFALNSFPDYPKYSIWHNAYFVSANKSAPQFYAMERDAMLAGNPNATIQSFTVPQLATNGFFSILPAHSTKGLPNSSTPGYVYYFQDDGWNGVANDHIKIWEIDLDWTSGNSSISTPQQLAVSPFDSEFTPQWDDIEQPGTNDRLDGIPTAFMYMAQYREFPGYSCVLLNHTVDVSGTDHAGIRWYELRKTAGNPWTVYQEGTFAPDNESRWLGSMCMDYQGNIGLAYSVSGPTVYPSIRYTGRLASDPLGQMTLTEETIVNGSGVQTGPNRWGDYAQMTIDPSDDATFWYTGEYVANNNDRRSRVASFKIASDATDDIGVVAIDDPNNGSLSTTETVTVTINNFGLNDQSNFPVSYTVDGGAPITETYSGTITSGTSAQYTFTGTANLGTPGNYNIKAYTGLAADAYNPNDTTFKEVQHLFANNVGLTAITTPNQSGNFSASEIVTVTVENFGTSSQTGFPIVYTLNGGAPISETFTGTLAAGANNSFSFAATADLSALGTYDFVAYTNLSGDSDINNDTSYVSLEHEICQPTADCSYGDGYENFQLEDINNSTTCSPQGYGDYTNLSTDLEQGETYDLIIQSGYDNQVSTVWIDFNDNFSFESNEMVITDEAFGTTSATIQFPIDANAALGPHMMRARTNWAQFGSPTITDPCTDVTYGETEDYMVNIVANQGGGNSSNIEEYDNVKFNVINLGEGQYQLQIEGLNETVEMNVHNTIGQMVLSESSLYVNNSMTFNFDLSNEAKGYYLVKISNNNFSKIQKISFK